MKSKSKDLQFKDIKIDDEYRFVKKINEKDVNRFAELTGDYNPLHLSKEYGKKTKFGENIVHGALLSGLFSTLVGMYCPGKNGFYLSQSANYRNPVLINQKVAVRGVVVSKSNSTKIVVLKTEIYTKNKLNVDGVAKVIFFK